MNVKIAHNKSKVKTKSIFNAFGVDEPTAYVIGKFIYFTCYEWERIE